MRRVRDKYKRLWGWLGWVIPGILIITFLSIVIPYGLGWRFNVTSGESMEPTYYAGGLVITRPVAPEEIETGDIILFRVPVEEATGYVCHRVIDISTIDEGLFFETQGDNNFYPDAKLVPAGDLEGRATFYIPEVGKVTSFYQGEFVLLGTSLLVGPLVIAFIGIIIISMESSSIYDRLFRRRDVRRKERLDKMGRR